MESLYKEEILNWAKKLPKEKTLKNYEIEGQAESKLCGSSITISFKLDESLGIKDYGFHQELCALGKASAAILFEECIGKTHEDLKQALEALDFILEKGKKQDLNLFEKLNFFTSMKEYKNRHHSIKLPFISALRAFEKGKQVRVEHA